MEKLFSSQWDQWKILDKIDEGILNIIQNSLKPDRLSILLDLPNGETEFFACRGLSDNFQNFLIQNTPWTKIENNPPSIFISDTEEDPRGVFMQGALLQEGIRSFASFSFLSEEKISGRVILYFNKPHHFSEEEVELLESITNQVAFIIDHKWIEENLSNRVKFEQLITTLSTNFISVALDEIDNEINGALEAIGEFAGVDRSYVFLYSNEKIAANTHEWCEEGIVSQKDKLQNMSVGEYTWFHQEINRFKTIHVPSVAKLPPEVAPEKAMFEAQDIQSLLIVPILSGINLIGYLGFDSVREEKNWADEDIALLKIVGEMFAHVLERKRIEELLEYRVELEAFVANLSTKFINLSYEEIDKGINDALGAIGDFTQVDRSYIFRVNEDKSTTNTHEWCSEGIEPQIRNLQYNTPERSSWFWKQIDQFNLVHIPFVENMPSEGIVYKELFQSQSIKSLLIVPMTSEGALIGYLGLDSVKKKKNWFVEDITLLQILGETFVNALERQRTEQKIRKTTTHLEQEVEERKKIEKELEKANINLEEKIGRRTKDLEDAKNQLEKQNKQLKETKLQMFQTEKMASLGTLVAGVAHEVNNPANFSLIGSQNIRGELTDLKHFIFRLAGEDLSDKIRKIFEERFTTLDVQLNAVREGTERIKTIVSDLRAFSRIDETGSRLTSPLPGLKSTLFLVKANYQNVADFVTEYQFDKEVMCMPEQLNQVFMNIMVNACQSIQDKQEKEEIKILGKITIQTSQQDNFYVIKLSDTGGGIGKKTQEKIFEPFYTTRPVGQGTGLGLSVSYGIIEKHHGKIEVDSVLGQGTTFTIRLPLHN